MLNDLGMVILSLYLIVLGLLGLTIFLGFVALFLDWWDLR